MAHTITEAQAEAVLAEIRPWLRDGAPIDHFRARLEKSIIRFEESYYYDITSRAEEEAVRRACRSARHAKTALLEIGKNIDGEVFLPREFADAFFAAEALEEALSKTYPFSAQEKARKGRTPRIWYRHFVRDLAYIAERLGIYVTTAGDRADNPAATPFTRFVFAIEKLLPEEGRSRTLAACAKRIDRTIAKYQGSDWEIARGSTRRKQAGAFRDK